MKNGSNRRQFLKVAGASAAACATASPGRAFAASRVEPAAVPVPFTLGMASYTLREFPGYIHEWPVWRATLRDLLPMLFR